MIYQFKKILFLTAMILSFSALAENRWYGQISLTVWTRNFEEATPSRNNDGVEKTEGGFAPGLGYHYNSHWAFELEFLPTMGFTVNQGNRTGTISMWALTLAPKYTFSQRYFSEKLSFFVKFRLGYTKMTGTSFYGNTGSNSSYTLGPAVGMDYKINDRWQAYVDIGGLWASGDIEDYDFHPWQIGGRYLF
jgi:hypothetical protein